MYKYQNTDLVILVGGKGKRLKSITNLPKPLIKINNKPFIRYLLNFYTKYNFRKIYLITSYKSEEFFLKFHKKIINSVQVECLKEKKPLDTAGALNTIRNKISKKFILINGDSFLNFDISKVKILNKNKLILIRNKNYHSNKKLSNLFLNNKKKVVYKNNSNYMNAGIYFFTKEIFKLIPKKQRSSLEEDIIPKLIKKESLYGDIVNEFFIDIGTPKNLKKASKVIPNLFSKKTAIFDRDGTINYDYKYVHSLKRFKFKSGIIKSFQYLTKKNFQIFIVTNQSGIARGLYSLDVFYKFHKEIKELFLKKKIIINDVYFCTHHPKVGLKKYRKNCNCRKPKNGLYKKLEKEWSINKKKCFMIGDKKSDFIFSKRSKIIFSFPKKDVFKQIRNLSNTF